jgi:hypothetical protein
LLIYTITWEGARRSCNGEVEQYLPIASRHSRTRLVPHRDSRSEPPINSNGRQAVLMQVKSIGCSCRSGSHNPSTSSCSHSPSPSPCTPRHERTTRTSLRPFSFTPPIRQELHIQSGARLQSYLLGRMYDILVRWGRKTSRKGRGSVWTWMVCH